MDKRLNCHVKTRAWYIWYEMSPCNRSRTTTASKLLGAAVCCLVRAIERMECSMHKALFYISSLGLAVYLIQSPFSEGLYPIAKRKIYRISIPQRVIKLVRYLWKVDSFFVTTQTIFTDIYNYPQVALNTHNINKIIYIVIC